VTGAIAGSSVTVTSGGVLSGTGTVGGLTLAGGTLSPGGSIGTLHAAGNSFLESGSTYLWEISSVAAGHQDVLAVNGTLQVSASSGTPMVIKITSLGLGDFVNN
jgi:fibronectin-binding autotransporter adhesin